MSKVIQLPLNGAGIKQLFGGSQFSLDDIGTTRLQTGQFIQIQHDNTGATLTYVLLTGANPSAPEDVYGVTPDDYNLTTNNVHWSLVSIEHSGQPALWNPDIATGAGGFNIQMAESEANPALVLSPTAIILKTDFN